MKKILILISILFIIGVIIYKVSSPIIPGESEEIKLINTYLDQLIENLNKKNIDYVIEKSKNKQIYFVLVKIKQLSEDGSYMIPSYVSYYVDTKTNNLLTKEQVLKSYGYQVGDVIAKINNRLKIYYEEESKLGYVDSGECDFEQYKNFYRNIEDIEQIYELYVKNNKLYIYIPFDINSIVEDKEYFEKLKYDPFEIEL